MKIYNELYKYRLLKDRKSIDHYNIIYNRFIPFMSIQIAILLGHPGQYFY
jgi:hypothetical protein